MSINHVAVHPSQFPDRVREQFVDSLTGRSVRPRFLYETRRQIQNWLAVSRAYSPFVTDPSCAVAYRQCFTALTTLLKDMGNVDFVSLGCGSGEKDALLIDALRKPGRAIRYFPADVSLDMVLLAARDASLSIPPREVCPVICDLAGAADFEKWFRKEFGGSHARVIAAFGLIPNFEPRAIVPRLRALLRPNDRLLISANLAPGPSYSDGCEKVLPQYDNPPTRKWLSGFLHDIGLDPDRGDMAIGIESCPNQPALNRIAAIFTPSQTQQICIDDRPIQFDAGQPFRLFVSYRYAASSFGGLLADYGIERIDEWITDSGEEGVFLCRPKQAGVQAPK